MSPSGLHINKPVVFVIFGLIGGFVVWYKFFSGTKEPTLDVDNVPQGKDAQDVKTVTETIQYQNKTIQEFKVFFMTAIPKQPKMDILFLHGLAFKAETWTKDIPKTLQFVRDNGYRAVAVDLPFARDQNVKDPVAYLTAIIDGLNLDQPVIVSPSKSGEYSLPFLFSEPATASKRAQGFVAVAPVSSEKYTKQYKDANIPTLVIVGSEDPIGSNVISNFDSLPHKTVVTLEGAKHACYLDKPEEFNNALLDFLKTKLT